MYPHLQLKQLISGLFSILSQRFKTPVQGPGNMAPLFCFSSQVQEESSHIEARTGHAGPIQFQVHTRHYLGALVRLQEIGFGTNSVGLTCLHRL